MSDPLIRPMQPDDLDWVSAAEARIHAFPWSRNNFADALMAGYSSWVMCDADQVCMGYAVLMLVMDEAHLLNISIEPERQRNGLGTRLLSHLNEVARHVHATQMFLEVRASNAAGLGLYERWGFEEIGRRKAYYPAPEGREDAIVMRRMI